MVTFRFIAALAATAVAAGAALWCRRRLGRGATAAALVAAVLLGLLFADVIAFPSAQAALEEVGAELGAWTYPVVTTMTFLETGAFVGLVAPGDFTLLLGGAIAGQGQIALLPLLGMVWAAAVLGDSTSFWLGRRYGRALLLRHGPRFRISAERLGRVERYFDRWGGRTIVGGRFIGLVRALAPFIAGATGMSYRRFLPFSVMGAGPWAATYVLLGFFFFRSLDTVARLAGLATIGVALAAAVVLAVALIARRSRIARGPVTPILPPCRRQTPSADSLPGQAGQVV